MPPPRAALVPPSANCLGSELWPRARLVSELALRLLPLGPRHGLGPQSSGLGFAHLASLPIGVQAPWVPARRAPTMGESCQCQGRRQTSGEHTVPKAQSRSSSTMLARSRASLRRLRNHRPASAARTQRIHGWWQALQHSVCRFLSTKAAAALPTSSYRFCSPAPRLLALIGFHVF